VATKKVSKKNAFRKKTRSHFRACSPKILSQAVFAIVSRTFGAVYFLFFFNEKK
jgi:hypothetical protein